MPENNHSPAGPAESAALLEAWAAELLQICPKEPPGGRPALVTSGYGLDDLYACYKARDRLEQAEAGSLYGVRAVDAFLVSFTDELGRGWLSLVGMEDLAGRGWWWSRVPATGEIREELDAALGR